MTEASPRSLAVASADAMRDLGSWVGQRCRGGDVVVLTGELGAGKTTFAQGVARGIGISEPVTSPTFVIARVHLNDETGLDLVHVDAYRVGSVVELDDLDLEADLDRSVVVVEWGAGLAEDLSQSRLEVALERSASAEDEERTATLTAHGDHWVAILASAEWAS